MICAIVYSRGPTWTDGKSQQDQLLEDHARYLMRHYRRRIVLMGGPFRDDTGGLAIIEAGAAEDAERFLRADPAIARGTLRATWHAWNVVFKKRKEKRESRLGAGDGRRH